MGSRTGRYRYGVDRPMPVAVRREIVRRVRGGESWAVGCYVGGGDGPLVARVMRDWWDATTLEGPFAVSVVAR